MAAMAFLGLAHTFKRGEMIRVGLLMERLHGRAKQVAEIVALAVATGLHPLLHASRRADDVRLPGASTTWRRACSRCRCGFRSSAYRRSRHSLDRADRRDGQRARAATGRATSRAARRDAGRIRRAHLAGRGRLMFATTSAWSSSSLILLGFMIVVLPSGVWIAVTLGLVGFVAMALTTSVPIGSGARDHDLERERVVDARRAAAVHLDGRDPVPHQAVGGDVPRPVAVAAMAAGPADACERGRLRHLRRGVRLVGRDLRDDRQDRAARTREARLRQAT